MYKESLESIRGLAALSIALFHAPFYGILRSSGTFENAAISVTLFFVLSGFILSSAYEHRLETAENLRVYTVRRFTRIYPLHLFALGLMVSLELVKLIMVTMGFPAGQAPFVGQNDIPSLVANVFLLHAIIPFPYETWVGPSWSISVEFYVSISLAVFYYFIRKMNKKIVMSILLLASLGVCRILHVKYPELEITEGVGLAECFAAFVVGSIFFYISKRLGSVIKRNASIFELLSIMVVANIYLFNPFGFEGNIFIFGFFLMVFSYDGGLISKILNINALRFLGKISYSLYLLHGVFLTVISGFARAFQSKFDTNIYIEVDGKQLMFFHSAYLMDLFLIAYVVAIIPISYFSYIYVERNFQRYLNRKLSSKKAEVFV